jgi:hypothetical protein
MHGCIYVRLCVCVCVCVYVCRVLEMGRYIKAELHSDPSFDTEMYQNALYPFIFFHSSHGISLFRFNFEHCVCMYASVCMFVCMHAYKYECMYACMCVQVCTSMFAYSSRRNSPICSKLGMLRRMFWNTENVLEESKFRETMMGSSPDKNGFCMSETTHVIRMVSRP